jgi:hypothetical protein
MKWWDWLGTLPQGQATFLGSFVGLFGVTALVNAHLNRRRDDRLRAEERRSVGEVGAGKPVPLMTFLDMSKHTTKRHHGGFRSGAGRKRALKTLERWRVGAADARLRADARSHDGGGRE